MTNAGFSIYSGHLFVVLNSIWYGTLNSVGVKVKDQA